MEIAATWLMFLAAIGIGYCLGLWHQAPMLAARQAMQEQDMQRLANVSHAYLGELAQKARRRDA